MSGAFSIEGCRFERFDDDDELRDDKPAVRRLDDRLVKP
jgi:hypothetical protein